MNTQTHKHTNTQKHKYKFKNTNTNTQIHKYTNTALVQIIPVTRVSMVQITSFSPWQSTVLYGKKNPQKQRKYTTVEIWTNCKQK